MSAKIIRLQSPAKLNLWLKVLGRRPDGYHELDTLMCPVSLYDELTLALTPESGINLAVDDCLGQAIPADGSNLAFRAAELFLISQGLTRGVDITLCKHIPAGAGLGGGSSNAAAVLWGLNALYDNPLTADALAGLALKLGADVPFFLLRRAARALGIGEKLTPYTGPLPKTAVIIFPGIMASTAKIYQNLNLTLTNPSKHSICLRAQKTAADPWLGFVPRNDLEAGARALFPEIEAAKDALRKAGLCHVLMTGSGSAVFGLCQDLDEAQRLVAGLEIKSNQRVFTVEILNKFDIML